MPQLALCLVYRGFLVAVVPNSSATVHQTLPPEYPNLSPLHNRIWYIFLAGLRPHRRSICFSVCSMSVYCIVFLSV